MTLKEIALELVEKYEDAEESRIWEYSGRIEEDEEELRLEIENYKKKIESFEEPERKTGKWVYKTTDAYIQRTCSACGWLERMYYRNRNQDGMIRNYCPNCGARMEVEE